MLKEKESSNVGNSEVNRNVDNAEQNIRNNMREGNGSFLTQGFSRFRNYGISAEEVHMLRIMFHTSYLINNRGSNPSAISWTPEDVIRREEEWISQNNGNESDMNTNLLELSMRRNILRIDGGNGQNSILNIHVRIKITFYSFLVCLEYARI